MDDRQIIDLYLSRNEEAIEHTSNKYGRRLHSLSLNIVENLQDAEECVNDTYLSAWNMIPPHKPYEYLFAFLARIVRNFSINCCKKSAAKKRNSEITRCSVEMAECLPSPDGVETLMSENELKELFNAFLDGLDENTRNVFVRRYWYIEPIAKISKDMKYSESKVTSMLYRTRKRLRNFLAKNGVFV